MKTSIEFIFLVSFVLTLLMGTISYLTYKRHQNKELLHLTEFWASLGVNIIAYYIFRVGPPQMIGLSMIGWVWPLKTTRVVLQDYSGAKNLMKRWQYIALGGAGFISVALGGYGYPFQVFALPLALAVGVVGLMMTLEAYRKTSKDDFTPIHQSVYFFLALLFVERLTYPIWRISDFMLYGHFAGVIVLTGLAVTTIACFMELLKQRRDSLMDHLMKDRNDKLLGQSKYSELGMMSAGIAHEINNPLAVIQARTTQLLRIYKNPDRQQDLADGLQQILYTSERIGRTIQGVREFVHQDEKTPAAEIPLKNLIDDVLAFCGQRMKNHGVNLRFYGIDNFTVIGNKIQLEQIILNLLNNSFDAIEYLSDKWIEVSAHGTSDKIQIYFKDSGSGIPPEIASRIMEPFFSTKDLGKGTGLGLALARGIAEKHGGTLQYLEGSTHTTFLLELPRDAHQDWGVPLH